MSTDTQTQRISFNPTLSSDRTAYSEEGNWYTADKVRFYKGKPQNIGGWNKKLQNTFGGSGRDSISWRSLDGQKYLAWATEGLIHLYNNGSVYDITPVSLSVSVTAGEITASAGSPYVHVSNAAHGRLAGDYVHFVSCSALDAIEPQGQTYKVVSAATNTFKISASASAVSDGTTGSTSFIYYLLAAGPSINTAGLGYGADAYNNARASVTVGGVVTLGGWGSPAEASDINLNMRQWSLHTFGENLLATPRGGRIYQWVENNEVTSRCIEVPTTTTAGVSTGVPLQNNFVLVSPISRHVISLGCTDITGVFDPMVLRISDAENINEWTPTVSTTSEQIRLNDGNELVTGINTRDTTIVLSDTAAYALPFVGPPFTFDADPIGTNCGVIGPHAGAASSDLVYWMGRDNFYYFDGTVKILPCMVLSHVFDDFNLDAKDKVYCGINEKFSEVIWLYCSSDSSECDRYVIFGEGDGTANNPPYWTRGTGFFTTWEDKGIFDVIHTTGNSTEDDGYLIENEPPGVYTADGKKMDAYLESSYFDIPFGVSPPGSPDGNFIMYMDKMAPDFTFTGTNAQTDIRITTREYAQSEDEITKGPYNVQTSTKKISLRVRGRQAKIRIDSSIAGTSWRLGSLSFDVGQDGDR
jgi:hypothetical protein